MLDEKVAPKPKPDVDFRSLPTNPTPEQFFLLSRVDGQLTVGDLCKVSGLGREKTKAALVGLARAGLIEVPGVAPKQPKPADREVPDQKPAQQKAPPQTEAPRRAPAADGREAQPGQARPARDRNDDKSVTPRLPVALEDFDFDPGIEHDDVALDLERRREIVWLHSQLDDISYYELFDVETNAGRKDIKKAYIRLSKRYHPDKFFRKDVGAYGKMLETIFRTITSGYRTLSSKAKRKEYDQRLAAESSQPSSVTATGDRTSLGRSISEVIGDKSSEERAPDAKREAAAMLLVRRGDKRVEQGDLAAAAAEYRRALALNRDVDLALRVSRTLFENREDLTEAGSFARAAIKLDGERAESWVLLGRIYGAQGDQPQARKAFTRALEIEPDHEEARSQLEWLGGT